MTQFSQRLGFNLPDAFTGNRERLADFFQGMLAAIFKTEPHLDDLLFARSERAQHLRSLVFQVDVDHGLGRRNHAAVFDEVAQVRIFLFSNRSFEGNRLLRDLQNFPDFRNRDIHALGNFFRSWFAPQFLYKLPRGADQLVDRFDHVYRDSNRTRLVGNGTSNCLPDPPRRISRKLIPAAVLELVDRFHQTDVALLDQIQELQTAVGVLLGDRNYESQVSFD